MMMETKRYKIRKIGYEELEKEPWNPYVEYFIELKDGYEFIDGNHSEYAEDIDDLRQLIKDIVKEVRR